MSRKPVLEGGKRDEIMDAALELFFEKGYDATSIRTIMRKVGSEVGLFYYYFENKDDVFDKAVHRFLAQYEAGMEDIVQRAKRDPFRAMNFFFHYMQKITKEFRDRYAEHIHQTVRWAIQEYVLTMIVPYVRQIIEILMQLGAKPSLDIEVAAQFIARGAGSIILHEDEEFMLKKQEEVRKGVNLIMGLDARMADLMFPIDAEEKDIKEICDFIKETDNGIFAEKRAESEEEIKERIAQKEIFLICHEKRVAGLILFSKERKEVDYLAVANEFRHRGVATRLFVTAMAQYPLETKLSMVIASSGENTNRAEAEKFMRRFGFESSETPHDGKSDTERRSMIIRDKRTSG